MCIRDRYIRTARAGASVELVCRLLEVSRSGYYEWLGRKPSLRRQKDQELKRRLLSLHPVSYTHLDVYKRQELTRLLRICSNNLNQYAKRAHESGNVYAADIDDLRTRLDELWETADGLLRGFANIP